MEGGSSTTEYRHGEVAVTVAIIEVATSRKLHENGYNYALRKKRVSLHPFILKSEERKEKKRRERNKENG